MWRLCDMDSLKEQPWDNNNEASDGIPVLASDSDESVIFIVERPLPSASTYCCQVCHSCLAYLFPAQPVTLLPPLVSTDQVFYSILINIFYWKNFSLVCMDKKLIIWYILFVFLGGRKPSRYYCGSIFQLSGGWPNRQRETWRKKFGGSFI